MIGKYLTIFWSVANFISVSLDSRTPAMRLGLAKQPLTYKDILCPGENGAAAAEVAAQREAALGTLEIVTHCESPSESGMKAMVQDSDLGGA